MEKSLIALAFLATVSACTTTPAQEPTVSAAAEAKDCKVVEDEATGSLINRRQECQTPAPQKDQR